MATLDIVSLVRREVHERLSVRVPEHVPDPRPDEFVVVGWGNREARVPGTNGLLDEPQVEVWCWAKDGKRCRELSDGVSDLLLSMERTRFKDGVVSVTETSRGPAPDPETGLPRWHSYYTFTTYRY